MQEISSDVETVRKTGCTQGLGRGGKSVGGGRGVKLSIAGG